MIWLDGHILGLLDIENALEDGQAVANTGYAHGPQIIMLQSDKCLSHYLVFYAFVLAPGTHVPARPRAKKKD